MNRWLAALPLIALAALAVLFAGYALHRDPHVIPKALVGKSLPDLTLPAWTAPRRCGCATSCGRARCW